MPSYEEKPKPQPAKLLAFLSAVAIAVGTAYARVSINHWTENRRKADALVSYFKKCENNPTVKDCDTYRAIKENDARFEEMVKSRARE